MEQGRKRTEEMSKLTENDKGDLYDFRLDGGISAQVFEGTDYSDTRNQAGNSNSSNWASLNFIDTGKRERKVVNAR